MGETTLREITREMESILDEKSDGQYYTLVYLIQTLLILI